MASCFGGGGGGGDAARFASGLEGGAGGVTGLTSGFARVVVVGCEVPFLSCRAFSCSCSAGFVVACVPVGFPDVVEVAFSSLAPAAPEGDVVVPSFEVFAPGPVVPGAPPLLASLPFPVGGRFVGRA